tara:strand:- start:185 stop:364 length:180 start_codon:yes stop_codon:yes gene_type:complete
MFPSFVSLAAAAELLDAAEAVPEDPPPQANNKAARAIRIKIFLNIEYSPKIFLFLSKLL